MTGPVLRSLTPLFASPLLRFALPGAAALNARILAEVAAMRAASPGIARSNQHGWHSEADFFGRAEPGCAVLRGQIMAASRQAVQALAPGFDLGSVSVQAEGWVNVNGPGAYNTPHDHPGWTLSGCYYVSVPAEEKGRSGLIEFLDTRMGVSVFGVPDAECFASKHAVRPAAGEMLLFPCWLKHWVYPNESTEERVSVAFNLRFMKRG
jgi:uncharacterized protein (TIGR02466 family)